MNESLHIVGISEAAAPAAFEEFVARVHARLYSALCLVTHDRIEAEDVMQEALLKVWERWDRVRQMDNPVGYLYRTAFNLWRKRARSAVRILKRAAQLTRDDDLSDLEGRIDVVRALSSLTPRRIGIEGGRGREARCF